MFQNLGNMYILSPPPFFQKTLVTELITPLAMLLDYSGAKGTKSFAHPTFLKTELNKRPPKRFKNLSLYSICFFKIVFRFHSSHFSRQEERKRRWFGGNNNLMASSSKAFLLVLFFTKEFSIFSIFSFVMLFIFFKNVQKVVNFDFVCLEREKERKRRKNERMNSI